MSKTKAPKVYEPKYKHFSAITYLSEFQLAQILEKCSGSIDHYAYILHDKDVEDGKPKAPHYHLLVVTHSAILEKTFRSWFVGYVDEKGRDINTLVECTGPNGKGRLSMESLYSYLTHKNAPDKYQYSDDAVVQSDGMLEYVQKLSTASSDDVDPTFDIIMQLMEDPNPLPLIKKYGKNFLYHYSQYKLALKDIGFCLGKALDLEQKLATLDARCSAVERKENDLIQLEMALRIRQRELELDDESSQRYIALLENKAKADSGDPNLFKNRDAAQITWTELEKGDITHG